RGILDGRRFRGRAARSHPAVRLRGDRRGSAGPGRRGLAPHRDPHPRSGPLGHHQRPRGPTGRPARRREGRRHRAQRGGARREPETRRSQTSSIHGKAARRYCRCRRRSQLIMYRTFHSSLNAPLAGIALLLFAAGCEQMGPPRTEVLDRIEQTIDESRAANGAAQVPPSVSSALISTINLGTGELPQVTDDQRFDVAVSDVPAAQFLMSLVDGTRYNMVVHPEVRGSITLNLNSVTIPEVLEAVRDVYGYEFVATDYGFQVLPARLQARIYQINYLNVER